MGSQVIHIYYYCNTLYNYINTTIIIIYMYFYVMYDHEKGIP